MTLTASPVSSFGKWQPVLFNNLNSLITIINLGSLVPGIPGDRVQEERKMEANQQRR